MKDKDLLKALEHAIKIIEMYQYDIKHLQDYIDKKNSIDGFCQGTIYKDAIADIEKLSKLNGK